MSALDFLDNTYVVGGVTLLFVLYGGLAGPKLPSAVKEVFQNPVFQLLLFTLIAYRSNKDPVAAMIIAGGFYLLMTLLQRDWFSRGAAKVAKVAGNVVDLGEDAISGVVHLPGNMYDHLTSHAQAQ
jgi:hypothetical protein